MHSDKESKMEKLSVLLLDVAGTITSLEYVKEKLLAFILEESPSYLKDHIEEEAVKNALKELQGNDKEIDVESSVEIIKKLTGQNSDDKNLKFLQALISKAGYEKGTLKAHIFPDVKVALANWSKDRKVAVYSSGDIEAQKLIFSNSVEGNLTSHISKFFDLSVGVKTAVESYNKISDELKVKCEEIVFVSDDPNELKAAKEAGLVTALMKREGNEEVSEEIAKDFTFTITSLADLPSDISNKRKVEDSLDGSETPPCKLPKTDENEPKDEVSLPKIDENGSEEQSESTEKKETEDAMEVDSITEDTKKSDEQNVPTETSMETEEVVGDKALAVEPEKTEPENITEKSDLPTDKSNSEETDAKTETIDDINKVVSVENSTEKTKDTEDTTSQEKQNEAVPTDNGVEPMVEAESVAKTNSVNSSKDVDSVEQAVPELDSDKAATTNKVCEESVNVTEEKKVQENNSKLEESKEEPDLKTIDEVKEGNEKLKESNNVEAESKDETNDVKEKTIDVKEDEEKKDLPEKSCVDKESVEEKKSETAPEVVKESTKENGSASESQNGKISSEVSNGVVNGQDSCDKSSNGQSEEATDIKVKKAETNVEAPAVAVEV